MIYQIRHEVLNMDITMWDKLRRISKDSPPIWVGSAKDFLARIGLPGGSSAKYNLEESLFFEEIYRLHRENSCLNLPLP